MLPLRHLRLLPGEDTGFPFDLPLVQVLEEMAFEAPVTFFVGENGSGKSTLLEAVALAARAIAVGGEDLERDPSLGGPRRLAGRLRLAWNRKSRRGCFLRAEDFFGFTRRMRQAREELERLENEFDSKFEGYGRQLAVGSARGQRAALERYAPLETSSHGEAFLHLFQERFTPGGLFLLDEPEAALSPRRQLALLSLLKAMVAEDAQFLIATHSPILMAFPEAVIYSFDRTPPAPVPYEELEHVGLTRDFLASPERYLRHL